MQGGHGGGGGVSGGVGEADDGCRPAVYGGDYGGTAGRGELVALPGHLPQIDVLGLGELSVPDHHPPPVDLRDGAQPGDILKSFGVRRACTLPLRVADDGRCEWVFGFLLYRGDQSQQIGLGEAVRDDQVGDLRLTPGQSAGLVHDDGLDAGGGFQRDRVLEEHPAPGTQAGTHHDRGGGGQAERVWAGDHHHGDGEQDRHGDRLAGEQPAGQGQPTADECDQYQPERRPVGQPLPGRLRVLCLLNQPDDLRQRRVSTDLGSAYPQRAVPVDGGTDDGDAGLLVYRQALAGDHGLVDLALALLDLPVHGYLRSRAYQQQVPDRHLGGGYLDRLTVTQHHRHRRSQVQQGTDRVACPAPSTHLEPVPQQNECRQHGGRLVKHVPAAGQRHHQGVQPTRADRDGDQHHHVQGAGAQRPHRAREEDLTRVEDHRQAQQQRPHVLTQPERHRYVQAEDALADRGPDHDRDRQERRHQEPVTHVGNHRRHRHLAVSPVPHHLLR